MLHLNVPADPVNYQVLEVVQVGHSVESNATDRAILNVFHLGRATGSAPPNLATLQTNVRAILDGPMSAVLSDAYLTDGSLWRPLDDPFAAVVEQAQLWSNGSVAGDRYSTVGAWTVNIATGIRGRCFQGRKHFGPLAEGSTTEDEIAAASLAAFAAAAAAWESLLGIADGAGGTWNLVVFSRQSSVLSGPAVTLTWADMVSVALQPTIGTMRRRKQRAV